MELFLIFAKIGLFTFGGGYAMISLIENNCVEKKKWITHDEMMNITVIAESTPGPIAINCATYVGYKKAGITGAIISTLGIVLPSFIIILLISALLKNAFKNKYVQAVLRGLKPCVIGIVLAMGVYMVVKNCLMEDTLKINLRAIVITAVLTIITVLYKFFAKKKISPVIMIVIASVLGMLVYSIWVFSSYLIWTCY